MASATDEIIISDENGSRVLEGAELTAFLAQKEKDDKDLQKILESIEEQQAKRQAALAKLAALGLTFDDLKVLGLG